MEKGIINFTHSGNFSEFNDSVKKFLLKNSNKQIIEVVDYIYPIVKLSKNIIQIKDHINLSGKNPLSGPNFISLTNVYSSKDGIVVAGLLQKVHLNKKEKEILLKSGVKAYCYNLIPTVIFTASLGLKVRGVGITKKTEN